MDDIEELTFDTPTGDRVELWVPKNNYYVTHEYKTKVMAAVDKLANDLTRIKDANERHNTIGAALKPIARQIRDEYPRINVSLEVYASPEQPKKKTSRPPKTDSLEEKIPRLERRVRALEEEKAK